MVDSVPPSGSSGIPDKVPLPENYKGEFKVSPAFQKFWDQMFHQHVDPKQAAKMTEQFINQVWNDCNRVLQQALQKMKELEKQRKEDEDS